jgi:hypothetical protein
VRTSRRETPNAFVRDALDGFGQSNGQLVRIEVAETGYSVTPATLEEAQEFWESVRPTISVQPTIDETYRVLADFDEINALEAAGAADPIEARFPGDRRYVVTVQAGDISVVSPPSGVLAEKNILEIEDGEVTGILRAQMSSLTAPGQHVLSDEKLRELGRLMAHIEANFPFELGDVPRDQVLVDMEIKLMPDGELTVKQVRPFLISEPPSTAPVFRIDVSAGTEACGVFRRRSTNRGTREEFELKTLIRFLPGRHDLPGSLSTFTMNLIEEVLFGPSREVLAPTGPGTVRRFVFPAGEETLYRFEFEQDFTTGSGQTIHITMKPLLFTVDPVAPLPGPLVLDEAIPTNSFVPGAVPELVEDAGQFPSSLVSSGSTATVFTTFVFHRVTWKPCLCGPSKPPQRMAIRSTSSGGTVCENRSTRSVRRRKLTHASSSAMRPAKSSTTGTKCTPPDATTTQSSKGSLSTRPSSSTASRSPFTPSSLSRLKLRSRRISRKPSDPRCTS